jgi:hypothetical protein
MTDAVELFSESYRDARERFLTASKLAGMNVESVELEGVV